MGDQNGWWYSGRNRRNSLNYQPVARANQKKPIMKNTFLRLWAWITGSSVALFNFLAPILASSAATLLEQLAPIALDVVLSLADSKATGEIKRKQAVDEIQARAIATGIQASTSVVNATVELALQNLIARGKM